jgi:putative glutamine amidotransferase
MQPVIGVTTYDDVNEAGHPISALNTAYIQAVQEAGGLPVLIPNQLSEMEWRALYPVFDGILFTGGGDIRTEIFKGEPHPKVNEVDDERDRLELALIKQTVLDEKPFLGICRGCQVLNVAMGGTLYTHIPDQLPKAVRHDWYPDIPRNTLAHPVRIDEGSQCALVFGDSIVQVNSLHHQGIKELAPKLRAVGYAPDGLVEAVEVPDHRFGIAVQWHPEWLTDQQSMRRLFTSFVEAASR